ncbi:DUF4405 domain-containing protein [Candidatus Woesearchaeota archaeon]|nr:DUF4405 domain-containing protein [Candidatus Woesearchaeota archaeon]
MNKANYFVDLGMGIAFVLVACTGIIKFPGLLRSLGVDTLNMPWRQISLIHDWSGIVLAAFVLAHLIIHRKWIISMTKGFFKK